MNTFNMITDIKVTGLDRCFYVQDPGTEDRCGDAY